MLVYPRCEFLSLDTRIPLLFLLAGEDAIAPPGGCIRDAAKMRNEQKPVFLKLYPALGHGFDNEPWVQAYDASATADARVRVRDFLRQYLDAQ